MTRRPLQPLSARASPPTAPFPQFIEPQLCKLTESPLSGSQWIHEVKFDGYRMQLRKVGATVSLRTKKGLDWGNKFKQHLARVQALPDCILDGEMVALDDRGLPDFSALQVALSGDTGALVYYAFDCLFDTAGDLRKHPLLKRKARLKEVLSGLGDTRQVRYVDHFTADAAQVLASVREMNLEGIVSKRTDSPYVSGRSGYWTKTKCRVGQEVVVGGWTGSRTVVTSLLVGFLEKDALRYVGRVGTGFSARFAPALLEKLFEQAASRSPFAGKVASGGVNWLKPVLVAEVVSAGWTSSGRLRHAAFKGLRLDKSAEEISQELPT